MLGITITLIVVLLMLGLGWEHARAARALRGRQAWRPPPLSGAYPSVTVVRPVKGKDVEAAENFRAALDTGYPGSIETLFVFEDEEDPGYALARAAVEAHARSGGHGDARILLAGAPPPGRTGKISNMIAGEAEARGAFVAFGDSDTRPDRGVLTNLIEHLAADEGAGAAFAPPVVPSPPRTAGDVGHDIIINAYLTAGLETRMGARRELPFLMGQLMVFRRQALEAIGGSAAADGQLVDDMFLGARLVDHGYRNLVGTHPLHVINYGLGFGDFVRIWRRWLFCGGGMPASFVRPFVIRAASFYGAVTLAVVAALAGPAWAVAAPSALALLEGLHYARLHRLHGGAPIRPRHLWMVWMPYVLAVPIVVSMLIKPELEWRGHTYRVDSGARLHRA